MQYLFIVFVYYIYLCYCLYLDMYVVPFCLITKVNYWIIPNNLKVEFFFFNLYLWFTVKGFWCFSQICMPTLIDNFFYAWAKLKKIGFWICLGLSSITISSCLFYKVNLLTLALLLRFGIMFWLLILYCDFCLLWVEFIYLYYLIGLVSLTLFLVIGSLINIYI